MEDVRRRGLRAGSQLPTERQLTQDLGLSRTAVRNALALLEAGGMVTREVGRGTFLADSDGLPDEYAGDHLAIFGPRDVSPANVMAVRMVIEPQAMTLVAASATVKDFEEIDQCLLGGHQADSYEEFEQWDLNLHRSLIAATHNPLLIRVYGLVEVARHGQLWGDLKRKSDSSSRRAGYQCEHTAIVDSLKARDAKGARSAMLTHLRSVEENLGRLIFD